MALLDLETRKQISDQLKDVKQMVTLHVFSQELECMFCRETSALAVELAETVPDKIKLEKHNFTLDKEAVEKYSIDKIPAIAVIGDRDYGIRFYGIPGGYEFTSLLLAIRMVGTKETSLSPQSIAQLARISTPVHLSVYVTLTCPYCPAAVHLAHQMAMANPYISAEMIESAEFPHLANRDQVMAVPKTIIKGIGSFEGALPEPQYVDKVVHMVMGGPA
jgi:glutaredoxin-like protein